MNHNQKKKNKTKPQIAYMYVALSAPGTTGSILIGLLLTTVL